ncbi:hypothetical protein EYC98_05300 [Halieaceae bacterium IMCC14734]|uniref:Uncharacterized protein n=1 Tax=Candidatus Litorirhabdus singularis TaxID=2518993 RepID=A0ABT3TE49_9GAMM|nr:hypothetical protein [Candidatus Litorirhabdus singularis]MCX2980284.1 hypothetical protein [Candidatus Litorirhabdus singularis]
MNLLQREKMLVQQSLELKQLRAEVQKLQAQNDSMRQGMRRCVTCDYRLQVTRNTLASSLREETS